MNLLKKWWNSTRKRFTFTKTHTANTAQASNQTSTQTAEQYSRYYDIDDLPLKNFEKCLNGSYEYMTKDLTMQDESQVRFMDIYFKYIEEVGGGGNWAYIHREYADLKIRNLLLLFSQELIIKGLYDSSYCKQQMEAYDYYLPVGNELNMIDSYLASVQLSLDSVSKKIHKLNKQETKNQTLVSVLTTINNVNKVYLPYNSVLLIEFIEQLKALKEQQKQVKNGRLNK